QAATLAQTVLHETVGGNHPLRRQFRTPSKRGTGTAPSLGREVSSLCSTKTPWTVRGERSRMRLRVTCSTSLRLRWRLQKTTARPERPRFSEITHSEVVAMVVGVRAFLDRHLP